VHEIHFRGCRTRTFLLKKREQNWEHNCQKRKTFSHLHDSIQATGSIVCGRSPPAPCLRPVLVSPSRREPKRRRRLGYHARPRELGTKDRAHAHAQSERRASASCAKEGPFLLTWTGRGVPLRSQLSEGGFQDSTACTVPRRQKPGRQGPGGHGVVSEHARFLGPAKAMVELSHQRTGQGQSS
jgi:hypothetical protein